MNSMRTRLLVALVAVVVVALSVAAVGGFLPAVSDAPTDDSSVDSTEDSSMESTDAPRADDRPTDPSTNETLGYVDGYWYDDELSVDDRSDATLETDELEPVVSRAMARVEVIRNLTYENEVSVEVVSREEYRADSGDRFTDITETEQLHQNVNYEALFMVDRNTDATDAAEGLYGGAVEGYYEPGTDRIVLVSDTPGSPELDETVLAHELVHALQDQQFDLASIQRETFDQDNARNGLIEGDASWVEAEYDSRCEAEWACLDPGSSSQAPFSDINWGLYFAVYQPYDDGPDYVDSLLERGGWTAVNDAYENPPASSSAVIHPGTDRDPEPIEVPDRSNDTWRQYEVDGEVASETVGEAGMAAMFAAGVRDTSRPSVIESDEFIEADLGLDYDQPYTDGWAGDRLVTYVSDEADEATAVYDAVDHTGYVWRTAWESSEDSQQFVDGYLQLLEAYGAEPVADQQDTYVIDDEYPGAYYLDRDGETVTIVRAPSVDDLGAVHAGTPPAGEDTLEIEGTADEDDSEAGGVIAGHGAGIVGVGVAALGAGILIFAVRRRDTFRAVDTVARTPSLDRAGTDGPPSPAPFDSTARTRNTAVDG
ncbi:Hvo_1808 family surface protein [Halopiger djelfimassiliensis]|uniref:Hvo_1808 family surface protein n=1 Tax=Halopiger djelfimassiliensis TaxID=1293047 RepID=UPI000AAB18BF|nr:Hvo_1808 family surface protein [Halopiger djelfimassiliensis]